MGYYAGDERFAFCKYNDKQISDGNGIADLYQGGNQIRSVDQVDDVAYSKGDSRDMYRALDPLPLHHPEEKSSEDYLLDEAYIYHSQNMKEYFTFCIV